MNKPAQSKTKNPGTSIDWGKTSQDYANYRYGQPNSFYEKLSALGVGQKTQKILVFLKILSTFLYKNKTITIKIWFLEKF